MPERNDVDAEPVFDCKDMGISVFLPFDLLQEIFSYLSVKDLVNCAKVSVDWREAANSGKVWRPICEKLWWKNRLVLRDIESHFRDKKNRFCLSELSERLIPMSDWKLLYCQQKFIAHNWNRGYYADHSLDENKKVSMRPSFDPTEQAEPRYLFLPIVEQVGDHHEFSVMRIDGNPTKVGRLEEDGGNEITVVCVAENTIAYITGNTLKIADYENGGFSVNREHSLLPSVDELRVNTCDEILSSPKFRKHFIIMNSDYLIAGNICYFHVWDRRTGDKLGFLECPVKNSGMYAFYLHGDRMYYATCIFNSIQNPESYAYNIVKKEVTSFRSVRGVIMKILANDLYVVVVAIINRRYVEVTIYDPMSKVKVNSLKRIEYFSKLILNRYKFLLKNDLLFFLDGFCVKVMSLRTRRLKTKFYVRDVVFMYTLQQNRIILHTKRGIQVWDWKKRVYLYTLSTGVHNLFLYCDTIRSIFISPEKKVDIIGFW